MSAKEQEDQTRLENVFQAHKIRSDSLSQQNLDALLMAANSHHQALEAVQADLKTKLEEKNNEFNALAA